MLSGRRAASQRKQRLRGDVDPQEIQSEDLRGIEQERQNFADLFPDYITGITPVRSINSNMSTEEQNRLQTLAELRKQKQSLFKQIDIEKIRERKTEFHALMQTKIGQKVGASEVHSQNPSS